MLNLNKDSIKSHIFVKERMLIVEEILIEKRSVTTHWYTLNEFGKKYGFLVYHILDAT